MQDELLPHDRRITNVLLDYWNELRRPRPFPSIDELDSETLECIWESCFIAESMEKNAQKDYAYKYLGKNITKAYGSDLKGVFLKEIVSPVEFVLADKYDKVVQAKSFLVDEGEFRNMDNKLIKYRQCLVPFGPDEDTVSHIVGGMRYKIFE